jgi:hypothetical protein
LDGLKHRRSPSFKNWFQFGQPDVIQLAAGSAVNWRALETLIPKQDTALIEEYTQSARMTRVEGPGDYGETILAPLAVIIQLASMAVRIVKFDSHSDFSVGPFGDTDGVVASRGTPIYPKDALGRAGATGGQKQTYGADDATQNSQTPCCAGTPAR